MSGTRLMTFVCGHCGGAAEFGVPDRPAMRETPQTSYADDPLLIPACAKCNDVLGAAPAMFPVPSKDEGRSINAMAVEIRARWVEWLEAGTPPERVPFRVQLVRPRFAV